MNGIVLIPHEIQEKIQAEIGSIVSGASTIVAIENNPQFENAVAFTKAIKKVAAEIEETRDALVRPKNQEVKEINNWFKKPAERLAELERSIKAVIMRYQAEIEQKRIEDQRAADELARKEREKIEKAAREQREREEANRRAEEEARSRAAAAENEKERQKALAEARAAKKRAEDASSKAAMQETIAETVVAVKIESQISKAGTARVITYSGNIIDKEAAVRYCLDQKKLHLVNLNMVVVDKMITAEKENFSMPGIEVVKSESLRVGKQP